MAWLRRSRFRNREENHKNIPVSTKSRPKTLSKLTSNTNTNTNPSSHKPIKPLKYPPLRNDKILPKDKTSRRFLSFLRPKKDRPSHRPKTAPTHKTTTTTTKTPADDYTVDGTVDTTDLSLTTASTTSSPRLYYMPMSPTNHNQQQEILLSSSSVSESSETDLLFRSRSRQLTSPDKRGSWNDDPSPSMLLGSVIAPRQGSDMSQISTSSSWRRRSDSGSCDWSQTDRSAGSRPESGGSVSSGSEGDGERRETLTRLFGLRGDSLRGGGQLAAIPDNSCHSASLHGSSRHGAGEGVGDKESLRRSLLQRTASIGENVFVEGPSEAVGYSPRVGPRAKSFLLPVDREPLSFVDVRPSTAPAEKTPLLPNAGLMPRSITPTESLADIQSQPSFPEAETADADATDAYADRVHLIPLLLDRDLSEDADEDSASNLPTDLSIDVSVHPEKREPPQATPTGTADVQLSHAFPTALADDYAHVPYVDMDSSRHSHTSSSSRSTREDRGRSIRASILGTQMFDSDYDPSSASDSNSTGQESSTESAVMEDEGAASDGDGSYHFCNLPSGLRGDVPMKGEDSDSEVATASSDEDINALEELYADMFGDDVDELERDALLHPAAATPPPAEQDPSAALTMLGLFRDDRSCQSSVVSFDSQEFLEDDGCYDDEKSRSRASCSISMHDITTIHEENEEDVMEEEYDEVDLGVGWREAATPGPLVNGELHLRRLELVSQGTTGTGTFSSVTDDSYMCMSFDSFSSFSEKGSSPVPVQRKAWSGVKVDMSEHKDFAAVVPNLQQQQPFNEESSQFTFESSKVSFADSACSYDSFSSESVKYMVDILKEEAERRRSKIKERIAKIRESTDRVSHTSEYVASSLALMAIARSEDSSMAE